MRYNQQRRLAVLSLLRCAASDATHGTSKARGAIAATTHSSDPATAARGSRANA